MKTKILQLLLVILVITSCNNSQQKTDDISKDDTIESAVTDSTDAFKSFREHFSETSSFAYAEISGRKVLLISQETFGNDETTYKEAIEATIFALDTKGKIICLGSVRSQGTLYPVSLLDGKIMVAGHQFVRIYSIRGSIPELVLDSYEEGESEELTEMFRNFENGTSIKFERN